MIFIIRLFPEITIKSTPVRKRWSKKLADNIRILARRIDESAAVVLDWDRIVLRTKANEDGDGEHKAGENSVALMYSMLASTPGIAHFSQVHAYGFESMHDIYEHAFKHWGNKLDGLTFCVRAKRNGEHEFNSNELERYVGGGLNQHTASAGVKLKNPDETVTIEVKGDQCYIVEKRCQGLGGFPIGTQDDVLSLISGGFDSTVASYLMMRRGLKTHYLFFNLGGREHEVAVKELAFFLWNKFGSSHRVRFITVPFEDVVAQILQHVSASNMGVVLKRMMMRAAQKVTERLEVSALVTGEAISQVSSQTLHNLSVIDRVTEKLILRPLITMDKPSIISAARSIGTEEFCANIPEYCGVISVKPSAHVKLGQLEQEESLLGVDQLIDEVVDQAHMKLIDEVMHDIDKEEKRVEVFNSLTASDIIVDVRHPNAVDMKPLLSDHEVMNIPFYSLNTEWSSLDSSKRYLLYCDKGVMSQLHAQHLFSAGNANVAVYRPD